MSTNQHVEKIYYSIYDFRIGQIGVASTERGVCATFFDSEVSIIVNWLMKHFPDVELVRNQEYNVHVQQQLEEYFAGARQNFELELDMYGTEFQVRVWRELQNIPYGETISYGELSRRVSGNTKSSRAVGGANNKNPIGIIVPCHRVIGSNGKLVGYAGGLDRKEELLNMEKHFK